MRNTCSFHWSADAYRVKDQEEFVYCRACLATGVQQQSDREKALHESVVYKDEPGKDITREGDVEAI